MNLSEAYSQLEMATKPEDVFGAVTKETIKNKCQAWARITHPDLNIDKILSAKAFNLFEEWKHKAEKKLADGTYGDVDALDSEITIISKTDSYVMGRSLANGDISDIYLGKQQSTDQEVILKIVRNTVNNDLATNEANILKYLNDEAETKDLPAMQHIPKLVESFLLKQGSARKIVNVFQHYKNFYTLAKVIREYPNGLDLADAAWMINRTIAALLIAHQAGIVNGAITPDHILISPEDHNGVLLGWPYSAKITEGTDAPKFNTTIKAISSKYKEYYPSEIYDKGKATFGIDLYMLSACFLKLLGGDVSSQFLPETLPAPAKGLIRACFLSPNMRSSDIWEYWQDFDEVLKKLYGPRKFRVFEMPKRV